MERDRIEQIVQRLKDANLSYREGNPVMTDREYDELEHSLKRLDPNNEWFDKGVQDATPKTRKIQLPVKMMSLNKIKTVEELKAWASQYEDTKFVITPKFDGLSVGMTKKGLQAFTRGDGAIGQLCTEHLAQIESKVDMQEFQEDIVVRGEIIFTNSAFKKFRLFNPDAKNSRNSATGLINGDFSENKDYNCLSVFSYSILNSQDDKLEQLRLLNSHSFWNKIPYVVCEESDFDREDIKQLLYNLFQQWKEKFPIDGLVFDVNSAKYRHGETANGNPSYAIAYKDPDFTEKGEVVVNELTLQENREGIMTPVVSFVEPVNLSGADVSRVNGINMKYVFDWGIFSGTKLTIVRSGEVIPKIIAVEGIEIPFRDNYTSQKEYDLEYQKALQRRQAQASYKDVSVIKSLPWKCPNCWSSLQWDENKIQMVCTNPDCSERKLQSIVAFCKICGLKNIGEETCRQLFCVKKIETFMDLFKLTKEDLVNLEGWKETSINNFLGELDSLKKGKIPFAQFCHATGWFGSLGQKTIQSIIDYMSERNFPWGDWIYVWNTFDFRLLLNVPGIQEKSAKCFVKGMDEWDKFELDNWTICCTFTWKYFATPKPTGGKLSGMTICFTGFRDASLQAELESLGASVKDSISAKTNCLLIKDFEFTSSKVNKAKEKGIEVLTKDQFIQKYVS